MDKTKFDKPSADAIAAGLLGSLQQVCGHYHIDPQDVLTILMQRGLSESLTNGIKQALHKPN